MASIENIAKELKKRVQAVKLARSVSDFACRSAADMETQDFLWEKYQSQLKAKGELEHILEQVGLTTIELERAAEWRSVGLYRPHILQNLRLSHPGCSEKVLALYHQELIDRASKEQNLCMAQLTKLLTKAEPYLSA
jgi:hypothetical protein